MKKINFKKIVFGSITSILFIASNAQTLVNKEWDKSTGSPSLTYDFTVSTLDANNRLIVVGNSVMGSQKENFLITKYDKDGSTLWQSNFDKAGMEDFATAVATYGNETYVTGVANEVGNGDFNYLTMKLDANGGIVWVRTYNGTGNATDAPTAIKLDASGNVYVTGGSTGNGTLMDFCTIKYDNNGNEIWVSRYDYSGNYDGAIGLDVDPNGTSVVTGASGTSFQNWDFLTMKLDANGNTVATERTVTAGNSFDKPVDIKRDDQGNIYIAGSTQTNGNDINIKLIKISSNFQLQWQKTFDGAGLKDEASKIDVDANGNVYLAGYTEKTNGGKDILTQKYDANGIILWERRRQAEDEKRRALAKSLEVDAKGNVYVAGISEDNNGENEYKVIKYESDGSIAFEREYKKLLASGADAKDIKVDDFGNIYVTGKTEENTGDKYTTVKYSTFEKNEQIWADANNEPSHFKNQIIVKFDPSIINTDFVDSRDNEFIALNELIPTSLIHDMNEKVNFVIDFGKVKAEKIFKHMITADTISINRLGNEIKMQKFWSAFLLFLPEPISRNEMEICDSLNTMYPTVEFAQKNNVYQQMGLSNDPFLQTNQASLVPTAQFANANINIDPAWDIETGHNYVKVGVIDAPIDWKNEDFGDGTFSGSKIVGGWDFTTNTSIQSLNNVTSAHGTACAGIIGALRNNAKGIAGIAGGDVSNNNTGVQLFSLGIYSADETINNSYAGDNLVANALIEGATYNPNTGYGYGLNIESNSWGGGTASFILKSAVKSVFENNCIFVASRGNKYPQNQFSITEKRYPACFKDEWALNIGGSGNDGFTKRLSSNGDNSYESMYGSDIDLIAPGSLDIELTTKPQSGTGWGYPTSADKFSDASYSYFSGTSSACPHVAGVTALMYSKHNKTNGYSNNLAPEDVEFLLQKYATDKVGSPAPYDITYTNGPDQYSGYGLLNAGATLNKINWPHYRVYHSSTPSTITQTPYSNQQVVVSEDINGVAAGTYTADKVEVTHSYSEIFSPTTQVLDYWQRNSSATGYTHASPITDNTNGVYTYAVNGNQYANVVTVTAKTVCWFIKYNVLGQQINTWIPEIPANLKTAFSLHLYDPTATGTSDIKTESEFFEVYPNPSNNMANISFITNQDENTQIVLTNVLGEQVKVISDKKTNKGSQLISFDVTNFSNGIYYVTLKSGNTNTTKKLVISHN